MEANSILEALWNKGVQPEIISFLSGLEWTFIIMFTTILYGLTHTNKFVWLDNLLHKFNIHHLKIWISAFVSGLFFCFFKWEENLLSVEYISSLLRSIFFVVVFSNIFVDIPVFLIKKAGSILDKKETQSPATKKKKKS